MRRLLVFLLLLFAVQQTWAEAPEVYHTDNPICVRVNDTYLYMDVEPFLMNDRTYVPIRALGEALGAEVDWDDDSQIATIQTEETLIQMEDGQEYALVDGERKYLSERIQKREDRLFVPIRFIAESFSAQVEWDAMSHTVKVDKEGIEVPAYLQMDRHYTDDEIFWLARIVFAESRGESMEGKIAVANTVLNRVEDDAFPNTIYGVIFDTKYAVQYEPTANGTIYNTPDTDSVAAAKRALEGERVVADCLYFLNPRKATNNWIILNRPFYRTIGNHDFYL